MKLLVEKEIRLLLPAFMAAMALAIVPVWLLPPMPRNPGSPYATYLFLFGIVLLALSSFGREIGLRTLPFMLAQPLERARIWWTKVLVLVVFVALVFEGWSLSGSLWSSFKPALHSPPEILEISGLVVAVFTAGALWMTLLLRQVTAAFWLTILIPMAAPVVKSMTGMPDWMVFAALGLYAATAFFLARWQFLHLQDTAWTGGVIVFGGRRADVQRSTTRKRRPWAALLWKELQLQQITLVGMGCLLLLHLGTITARNLGAHSFNRTTLAVLELLGLIWFAVPFLAGGQAVAEERKLGTMAAHLCLPVSRRGQWFVKLIVVLVIGGLLSTALFYGVEQMIVGKKEFHDWTFVLVIFMGLALAGFYGSTLTSGVVQAIAAAVLACFSLWESLDFAAHTPAAFGFHLWEGTLPLFIGWPALLATLLWLSYRNFGKVSENLRLWYRNALVLTGVVVFTFGLTAAIYHRAWEFLTPLEPPRGTTRFSPEKAPSLRSDGGLGLAAVLPDGRLWVDQLIVQGYSGFNWGQKYKLISSGGNKFVSGSNWVDAAANGREIVAIRSDGTLWVSERPRPMWTGVGRPPVDNSTNLVQFGHGTDWKSVIRHPYWAMLLSKRDGTLWDWGATSITNLHLRKGPSLREFGPRRCDPDSDWDRLLAGNDLSYAYAWKKDGTAWRFDSLNALESGKNLSQNFQSGIALERIPPLDNNSWRNVTTLTEFRSFVALRDDGTLWHSSWNPLQAQPPPRHVSSTNTAQAFATKSSLGFTIGIYAGPAGSSRLSAPMYSGRGVSNHGVQEDEPALVQIGKDSDWAEIYGSWAGLMARKTDGSLWKWNVVYGNNARRVFRFFLSPLDLDKPPVRLGTHNDWVALGGSGEDILSLAADGSLWSWPDSWPEALINDTSTVMIGPSRKPTLIENIFGAQQ